MIIECPINWLTGEGGMYECCQYICAYMCIPIYSTCITQYGNPTMTHLGYVVHDTWDSWNVYYIYLLFGALKVPPDLWSIS